MRRVKAEGKGLILKIINKKHSSEFQQKNWRNVPFCNS